MITVWKPDVPMENKKGRKEKKLRIASRMKEARKSSSLRYTKTLRGKRLENT